MLYRFCLLSLIILFFSSFSILFHPIHLCLTEINFNEKNHSLEITHRIFWDDLERLFQEKYNANVKLGEDYETPDAEKFISDYLQKNFKLKINQKEVKINYLGREYERETLLVYMEVLKIKKLNTAQVTHSVMHQFFADQKNITNFTIRRDNEKEKKGCITIPNQPIVKLEF